MKVLFQNRQNALTAWGGDTTQMVETKKALERLGIEVDISLDPEPELTGYDLVHMFNLQTAASSVRQVRNAKRHGLPIALSTIYWDRRQMLGSDDYLAFHNSGWVRRLSAVSKPLTRLALRLYRGNQEQMMVEMLESADVLLPNSIAEAEIIVEIFSMPQVRAKSVMVINAVEVQAGADQSEATRSLLASLPDEYLLQVANFDPGKNQLNLIRALSDCPDIPLLFIGRGSVSEYLTACQVLGQKRGNTYFIDHVPHDQMNWFYKRARVHALPSLRESPGLATLEAAVNGANCVVSIHGPIMEYFGDNAWFCDPLKLDSISAAVSQAWASPRNTKLRDVILDRFTWDKTAQSTLSAYERALHTKGPHI